jgi:diguanylate cyclase (GGDEF)-like protein
MATNPTKLFADTAATVASLRIDIPSVAPDATIVEVLRAFTDNPELIAVPVVAGETPVGIVNRKQIVERFTKPYARELLGRKPIGSVMDHDPLIVDSRTDLDELRQTIMQRGMYYMYEGFVITHDGRYTGMGTGYDLMRAITERTQVRLQRLAHYDPITGLPNRLLFMDRLQQAIAQAQRNERLAAVMLLDLDRFKAVNDSFGHSMGDLLLMGVATRLVGCVRSDDTVARLGGDEFTVLLPEIRYIHDAATVAAKILNALAEPFALGGHETYVNASVGIALYPFHDDIETLLKCADTAMYRAKEHGGNQYEFYAAEMSDSTPRRLSMESALRRAVERHELTLHYQPQVDIVSGRIVGIEALLRWQHPELGLVPPCEFIALAIESGQILPIGEWVLHSACAQAKSWQDAGLPPLRVAVNVCVRQFHQLNFAERVGKTLEDTGLDSGWLELEMTESTLMQNTQTAMTMLGELKTMGVQLSVDDFGTGYSSLAYLKRFPIDALKIDGSFVCDIGTDPDDAAIVKAIIALAHNLDIRVVAEAVETEQQLAFLREHRCHEVQGFLLGRPVPAQQLTRQLMAAPQPLLRLA